ncbi:MAG: PLP-dependent aminotransferase family protein [Firmicutes bacterium]|nr:PLP-dependent aminotransferase family protein [Bacillota bacterium]
MDISLDRASSTPLYLQLRNQLREMILSGSLPPGYRLPPERKLAETLEVNRSTVISAYRELESAGLVRSHVGRGTSVTYLPSSDAAARPVQPGAISWRQSFSEASMRMRDPLLRDILELANRKDVISFAAGMSSPELMPVEEFNQVTQQVMKEYGRQLYLYGSTEGCYPLRESLSRLTESRGIACSPEEVLILTGSQQGLELAARALLSPGDAVVVEEPSFFCALQIFRAAGARVLGVPVDEGGMRVDMLEPLLARYQPKFIYTLTTFQNPSGTVLELERRKTLLDLAYRYQVPILEDDPYGELYYEGRGPRPLKSMDQSGYVIYLSTISKMLFPGLRVGWMAAPRPVVQQFAMVKQLIDLHTNNLAQMSVDMFLRQGRLWPHLDRLRSEYAKHRDTMLRALERHAPPGVEWNRPEGGFYIWCRLPSSLNSNKLLIRASDRGVSFVPGEPFFSGGMGRNCLRLNFTYPSRESIEQGIAVLMEVIREARLEADAALDRLETGLRPLV